MSDQSQTTANTPSEPRLCKMGCGFFGSDATGFCCSKCWGQMQTKKEGSSSNVVSKPMDVAVPLEEPTSMDVEDSPACEPMIEPQTASISTSTPKKRKTKKASYKNMLAGMMQGNSPTKDIEKEKESLRKVTGGGTFSKVEKI